MYKNEGKEGECGRRPLSIDNFLFKFSLFVNGNARLWCFALVYGKGGLFIDFLVARASYITRRVLWPLPRDKSARCSRRQSLFSLSLSLSSLFSPPVPQFRRLIICNFAIGGKRYVSPGLLRWISKRKGKGERKCRFTISFFSFSFRAERKSCICYFVSSMSTWYRHSSSSSSSFLSRYRNLSSSINFLHHTSLMRNDDVQFSPFSLSTLMYIITSFSFVSFFEI